jgi:hypothetical protein
MGMAQRRRHGLDPGRVLMCLLLERGPPLPDRPRHACALVARRHRSGTAAQVDPPAGEGASSIVRPAMVPRHMFLAVAEMLPLSRNPPHRSVTGKFSSGNRPQYGRGPGRRDAIPPLWRPRRVQSPRHAAVTRKGLRRRVPCRFLALDRPSGLSSTLTESYGHPGRSERNNDL